MTISPLGGDRAPQDLPVTGNAAETGQASATPMPNDSGKRKPLGVNAKRPRVRTANVYGQITRDDVDMNVRHCLSGIGPADITRDDPKHPFASRDISRAKNPRRAAPFSAPPAPHLVIRNSEGKAIDQKPLVAQTLQDLYPTLAPLDLAASSLDIQKPSLRNPQTHKLPLDVNLEIQDKMLEVNDEINARAKAFKETTPGLLSWMNALDETRLDLMRERVENAPLHEVQAALKNPMVLNLSSADEGLALNRRKAVAARMHRRCANATDDIPQAERLVHLEKAFELEPFLHTRANIARELAERSPDLQVADKAVKKAFLSGSNPDLLAEACQAMMDRRGKFGDLSPTDHHFWSTLKTAMDKAMMFMGPHQTGYFPTIFLEAGKTDWAAGKLFNHWDNAMTCVFSRPGTAQPLRDEPPKGALLFSQSGIAFTRGRLNQMSPAAKQPIVEQASSPPTDPLERTKVAIANYQTTLRPDAPYEQKLDCAKAAADLHVVRSLSVDGCSRVVALTRDKDEAVRYAERGVETGAAVPNTIQLCLNMANWNHQPEAVSDNDRLQWNSLANAIKTASEGDFKAAKAIAKSGGYKADRLYSKWEHAVANIRYGAVPPDTALAAFNKPLVTV